MIRSASGTDEALHRRMPGLGLGHHRITAASRSEPGWILALSPRGDHVRTPVLSDKSAHPDNSLLEFHANFHHSEPTELPFVR